MTIQETIKNLISKHREKNTLYKDYETRENVVNKFEQRKLSHNERVLNKLLEQNRQESIKKQLDYELKRRQNQDKQSARNMLSPNRKMWTDNSLMKTKNIFKNNKSILRN